MLGNGFGGFRAHGHRRRPAVGDTVLEEAGCELFVVQRLNADRINPVVPMLFGKPDHALHGRESLLGEVP